MKFTIIILITIISALTFIFNSCSTEVIKEIEMAKDGLTFINNRKDANDKIRTGIVNSPNLTQKQKDELMALFKDVQVMSLRFNREIDKLRVLLFKELVADKYQSKKVYHINRQIRKIYDERFEKMFDALYEAHDILGIEARAVYERAWINDNDIL